MKKIIVLLCFFIIGINNAYGEELITASLVKCVDGDTVDLMVDGVEKRYRLLAIDTPESVKPNTEVEAFGKDASQYTCDMLTNANSINIEYDELATQDKYDRELVWLWADDKLVQEALVAEGLAEVAYVYDKYEYVEELCVLQKFVILEKVGIWSEERKEGYCATLEISDKEMRQINEMLKYGQAIKKSTDAVDEVSNKISASISDDKFAIVVVVILLAIASIKEIKKGIK